MERHHYYISVQSKTIMSNRGDAPYEFEVVAAPEEIAQLRELFVGMEDFDQLGYVRNQIPGIPYHHDLENDGYDYYIKEVYDMLARLGTEETRNHIATMDLRFGAGPQRSR